MLNVALTGGIGSGKSIISRIFHIFGVPVYEADIEAKKLYSELEVLDKVYKEFGPLVFKDGQLLTRVLAKIVFNDENALSRLNTIIHPRVLRSYRIWCEDHSESLYAIMESAIVFEAGLTPRFDRIITVYAPEEICIQRVMKRDNFSREDIEERIQRQMNPIFKVNNADFIIMNDDKHLVIPQIQEIHKRLSILAKKNSK